MKRETWEETGIEVEEVVYHSSQPWPGMTLHNILFFASYGFFFFFSPLLID